MPKDGSFSWNLSRIVSIHLPQWPTDRLRRKLDGDAPPVDVPFVLARRDGQRRVVPALDRAAIHAGLRHGMPIAPARALSPGQGQTGLSVIVAAE